MTPLLCFSPQGPSDTTSSECIATAPQPAQKRVRGMRIKIPISISIAGSINTVAPQSAVVPSGSGAAAVPGKSRAAKAGPTVRKNC